MDKVERGYMTWTRHHWTLTFFYCLLIALFVTVCIYTYAGQQQHLPARNFGNVTVHGIDTEVNDFVLNTTVTTFDFSGSKQKFYFFDTDSGSVTITLPSKDDIVNLFPVKKNGAYVSFGSISKIGAGTITVTIPDGITDLGGDSGSKSLSDTDNVALDFVYQDGDLLWNP